MSQPILIKIRWSEFVQWRQASETTITNSSGVYEFWVGLKDNGKRRIYVGKADNLDKRFKEHLRTDLSNNCLRNNLKQYVWYYRFAVIENKADREDAEKWLYRHHEYECNEVEPSGSGRQRFVVRENSLLE